MNLDEDIVDKFQEDGVVLLKGVFSEFWIDTVARGIQTNLENPSEAFSERIYGDTGRGAYFNDYCNWQTIPEFDDFIHNSPAASIAGQLMKSENAVFYHEHVLVKEAGTSTQTPWHHDQSYYPVDGLKNCSIWMPVDPVERKNSIKFVRGSHKLGWFYPRKFATLKNYRINQDTDLDHEYTDVPDVDREIDKCEILRWDTQPGDCIVFHMKTLHAAESNSEKISRRVLSTRWLGDDCVLARRPWEVSPPILGGFCYGDKINGDIFPEIWKLNN